MSAAGAAATTSPTMNAAPKMANLAFPRERIENLRWRFSTVQAARKNPQMQATLRELARRNIDFFAGAFCWTYDPRKEAAPNHFPFLLYEYERDFLATLEEQYSVGDDVLVEKSRDMGVTWCVLLWTLHHWLFDPTFKAHLGSRKEEFVDKRGDMGTHFEIVRYMLKRLPEWLLPKGWDWRFHDHDLRIINPASGNAITGEATNPDFSRQGRYSVVFCDEFASVPCDAEVAMATSESTSTRIFVSTPKGVGNTFYQMRHGGKMRVLTLHWSLHPRKCDASPAYIAAKIDEGKAKAEHQAGVKPGCYRGIGPEGKPGKLRSAWYDRRSEKETDPRTIEQELDIGYLGSGFAVVDLTVVRDWETELNDLATDGLRVLRYERDGDLEIYEEPQEETDYIVTVDTSKGVGRDDSVIEVVATSPLRQVAEYIGQMPSDVLGVFGVDIAERYNGALLVIENDGMGLATCNAAKETGYGNIYHHCDYRDPNGDPKEIGLSTGKVRPEMVRQLMAVVRRREIKIRSLRLIGQLYTFEWVKADRAEGSEGHKDDAVLATMFALYALLSFWQRWKRRDPLPFLFGDMSNGARGMVST